MPGPFNPQSLIGLTTKRVLVNRADTEKPTYDKEKHTVELAFFSEEPQLDFIGGSLVYVKLSMRDGAINLERYTRGLAFTENHDIQRRLGKGSNPRVVPPANSGFSLFRSTGNFATSRPYAKEIFDETVEMIDKGFFPDTSGIARIDEVAPQPVDRIDGIPVVLATKWTPMEMCIATLGKDNNTGAARSAHSHVERGMGCSCACCTPQNPRPCCCCCPNLTAPPLSCSCACCNSYYPQPCCCCCDATARAGAQTERTSEITPATITRSATMPTPIANQEPAKTAFETMIERQTSYENFALRFGSTDEQKVELKRMANEFALGAKAETELFAEIQRMTGEWQKAAPKVPTAAPTFKGQDAEEINKRYSITRAIRISAGMKDRDLNVRETNCFEFEVSQQLDRSMPREPNAEIGDFRMPMDIAIRALPAQEIQRAMMIQRAGLDAATATAAKELIYTEPGDSFIDLLRNRARCLAMGATVLSGLQGDVEFSGQTGAGSVSWVGENPGTDVGESNLTVDRPVKLSPKILQSTTSYSRKLLAQSLYSVDNLVQNDLNMINSLEVDRVGMYGSGSANQPKGIYQQTGVNAVAMGGAPTFDKIVDLETAIAAGNADIGTMGYLTTPEVRGKCKKTPQLDNTIALPIWYNNELNGYRADVTNQISKVMNGSAATGGSSHGIIFGVWAFLLFGQWGALEIITDPYALKKQGMIEVTTYLMVDIALRYAAAFSKGTGLTVS